MSPVDKVKKPVAKGQKKPKHRHNNRDLGNGIMRWSRSNQYRRKGLYRLKKCKTEEGRETKSRHYCCQENWWCQEWR